MSKSVGLYSGLIAPEKYLLVSFLERIEHELPGCWSWGQRTEFHAGSGKVDLSSKSNQIFQSSSRFSIPSSPMLDIRHLINQSVHKLCPCFLEEGVGKRCLLGSTNSKVLGSRHSSSRISSNPFLPHDHFLVPKFL